MSKHVLIFDTDALLSMVVQNELIDLGFTSFDWSPAPREAIELAQVRCPNLIIAGDLLDVEEAANAVREICQHKTIPTVFIMNTFLLKGPPPAGVVLHPSFHPSDLREAIESAQLFAEHRNMTFWQTANKVHARPSKAK